MSRFIISRNNKSLLNETVFYLTKGNREYAYIKDRWFE